jgi:hypothetical protein
MTDYSELKRLAEAATPGPWQSEMEYPIIQPAYPAMGSIASVLIWQDAHFIAAANPAAVLALIEENYDLALQGRSAREVCIESQGTILSLISERDQLKAEIAGLKTGYAAYEDEVKGLRGEAEALRKRQQSADGYMDAFFKVASLLGIGARPLPPMEVFHGEMVPTLEAVLKDAGRYRWLRSRLPGSAYRVAGLIYSEGGQAIDTAIDAAMSKETNHG